MHDQDELRKALEQLTTEQPPAESAIYYRSPLEVAREEWRKRTFGGLQTSVKPEVMANWPAAGKTKESPPLIQVDQSTEEAFQDAMQSWQGHFDRKNP